MGHREEQERRGDRGNEWERSAVKRDEKEKAGWGQVEWRGCSCGEEQDR